VFRPTVRFTPDSGATDILIRESNSHILLHRSNFTPMDHPPAFAVANNALIYPTATGQLHLPSTTIYLDAYIFADHELADNLFGLAPLVNRGLTATFSNTKVSFDAPTTAGPRTILYGTKHPSENVWHFSLPRNEPRAMTIVRNETHAEIAMYAAASFGHPSSRTFHRAVQLGYLSNYPDLTAPMLRPNRPHTPVTALGHIAASRSNVRSTRWSSISKDASDTSSSDSLPSASPPSLGHKNAHQPRPTSSHASASACASSLPPGTPSLANQYRHNFTPTSLKSSRLTSPTNSRTFSSVHKSVTPPHSDRTLSSLTYPGVSESRPLMDPNNFWFPFLSDISTSNPCLTAPPTNSLLHTPPRIDGSRPTDTIQNFKY
jgi:hypothetical protein